MKDCCDVPDAAVVDMVSLSVYQALHQWRYQFFLIALVRGQIDQKSYFD